MINHSRGRPSAQPREEHWYYELVSRYSHDCLGFCVNILGMRPTWQQVELLLSVIEPSARIAVRAGHGVGKSSACAAVMIWWMVCRPFSKGVATAPNLDTLKKVLWSELAKWFMRLCSKFPSFQSWFEITKTTFEHKSYPGLWFFVARTARPEAPQGMAGSHADDLLYLVEEASAVSDDVYEVIEGALTGRDNKLVMIGNPTRIVGQFYEAFHQNQDFYKTFHWDGEESPLVSREMIEVFKAKYGETSQEYMIRVKGDFPINPSGMLIVRPWCDHSINRGFEFEEVPCYVISVDVAGSGRDSSVIIIAQFTGSDEKRKLQVIHADEKQDLSDVVALANEVAFLYQKYRGPVIVDSIGVGKGTSDKLKELGIPHTALMWGQPAWYKDRFMNQRAEGYWFLREAILNEGLSIPRNNRLIDQLCNLPYEYDEKGRLKLWSKERMRKQGIKSPDLADSLAMCFLVAYRPEGQTKEDEDVPQVEQQFMETLLSEW